VHPAYTKDISIYNIVLFEELEWFAGHSSLHQFQRSIDSDSEKERTAVNLSLESHF